MLPGGINPAGVAFFIACLNRRLNPVAQVFTLLAVFLGTLSIKGINAAGVVSGILTLVLVMVVILKSNWLDKIGPAQSGGQALNGRFIFFGAVYGFYARRSID